VEGGGRGLTVSGVSRNRGGFVKCVAIQKKLGIPGLHNGEGNNVQSFISTPSVCLNDVVLGVRDVTFYSTTAW
jgi:hypothetical protein